MLAGAEWALKNESIQILKLGSSFSQLKILWKVIHNKTVSKIAIKEKNTTTEQEDDKYFIINTGFPEWNCIIHALSPIPWNSFSRFYMFIGTCICNIFVKSTNKTIHFKKPAQYFPFCEFQTAQAISKTILSQMRKNSQNCQNLRAREGFFIVGITQPVRGLSGTWCASLALAITQAKVCTAKTVLIVPESLYSNMTK